MLKEGAALTGKQHCEHRNDLPEYSFRFPPKDFFKLFMFLLPKRLCAFPKTFFSIIIILHHLKHILKKKNLAHFLSLIPSGDWINSLSVLRINNDVPAMCNRQQRATDIGVIATVTVILMLMESITILTLIDCLLQPLCTSARRSSPSLVNSFSTRPCNAW